MNYRSLVALATACACIDAADAQDQDHLCRLYWPPTLVDFAQDLRIEEISVVVSCGEIRPRASCTCKSPDRLGARQGRVEQLFAPQPRRKTAACFLYPYQYI
jgi:hypothetical protein